MSARNADRTGPNPEPQKKKNMATSQNLIAITGNTYPVKDQLRAMGASWNAADKAWMISADKADKAREIVGSATPARTVGRANRYGSYRTIGQRQNARMRSGWSGCPCGSIEGSPRSSDCRQCQHDY